MPDIAISYLPKSLQSGDKIKIDIPFTLKVPASFSRLGHVGDSYQMTQWFPKPAVYDANGWHPMPYLDMGEFYSEFGNFDVSITLPENYVVAASGELQTESEEAFLKLKVNETKARVKNSFDDDLSFPPSSEKMKTIRFVAENVHDFAWFADKRFHVLKDEVALASGKKVDAWAFFTNQQATYWTEAANYVSRAVSFYSETVGEYPWPQATAVQSALSAGGGMEYPMITVIGRSSSAKSLDRVITHEVGHNWFYGIIANNERDHPWLDEGINSYYENRYMQKFYGSDDEVQMPKFIQGSSKTQLSELAYLFGARQNIDQAPGLHSTDFTMISYGLDVYLKSARAMKLLEHYLGTNNFDSAMQKYYADWKFKHPQPEDFRKSLEKESGNNLSWFFDALINSNKKSDYKILEVRTDEDWKVRIKNKAKIATPFTLSAIKNGETIFTKWFDGFTGTKDLVFESVDYDEIVLDAEQLTFDLYRQDNQLKTKGLFPKTEPLQFKFFGGMENPQKTQINWLPTFGWNSYDKTMLGLSLYSFPIPDRNWEFALMPMYGFNSKNLTGLGNIRYQFYPNSKLFHRVVFEVDAKKFSYNYNDDYEAFDHYLKIAPKVTFDLAKSHPTNKTSQSISLRFVNISQNNVFGINFSEKIFEREKRNYYVNDFQYSLKNSFVLAPFKIDANLQQGEGLIKLFTHYRQKVLYPQKKKALHLHVFAGWMDRNEPKVKVDYLISGINGFGQFQKDYLYDENLFGRNEQSGIFSQQIYQRDANLKTLSNIGSSSTWMLGFGIRSGIPNPLPIEPYVDLAIYPDAFEDKVNLTYSSGVALVVARDIFEVYFPIFESDDITQGINYEHKKYLQKVTFLLNINKLNPWKLLDDMEFLY